MLYDAYSIVSVCVILRAPALEALYGAKGARCTFLKRMLPISTVVHLLKEMHRTSVSFKDFVVFTSLSEIVRLRMSI
jgi:hypothetical protein